MPAGDCLVGCVFAFAVQECMRIRRGRRLELIHLARTRDELWARLMIFTL